MLRYFKLLLLLAVYGHSLAQSDLRGPIHSDQFTVRRNTEGIFATGMHYKPFPSGSFAARWIGIDPQQYPDQEHTSTAWFGRRRPGSASMVKFKKLVRIPGDVSVANIRISADVKYRLFINGRLCSRGPAARACDYFDKLIPPQWYFDQFDTRQAFRKGINSIAVEVSATDRILSSNTTGHLGLILEAAIRLSSGKNIMVKTDASWYCDTSRSYNPDMDIDAARDTDSWYTDTLYDPSWSHAVELPESTSNKWKMIQSELPQMMEVKVLPAQIAVGGQPATWPIHVAASTAPQKIRLEFDRLYTGYLGFSLSGKAGTRIHFLPAETPSQAAHDLRYTLRDGMQTYEYPELTDAKYIDIAIDNPGGPLDIYEIDLNFSTYPVEYTGSFHCSDTMLNALWENIRWIVQQNMQTYYMDSPIHQEPTSDAGDYLIESLINYYTFSSPLLTRQELRKIASLLTKTDNQLFHTSYMLLWLQMLLHYYEYTGDKDLLQELFPVVDGLLAKFHGYIGKEGIISEAPDYMFMDWEELYGRGFHHPPASWGEGYMTAFYYKGLLDGAKIAAYLGHTEKNTKLSEEAAVLKGSFREKLYDSTSGQFKNGIYGITHVKPFDWLPADTAITYSLPYVNALAALYDLAPTPGDASSILKHVLTQREIKMSPYFMYFVLEAIGHAGDLNTDGFEQMRRWSAISQHPVGLREGWTAGDFSHAWGGAPAYELSSKVLGIMPSKPGFEAATIYPHPGDLSYAAGTVKTPHGTISVDWKRSGTGFTIRTVNPADMPIQFILPVYGQGAVLLNGKKIRSVAGERQVEISTRGGTNFIEIR